MSLSYMYIKSYTSISALRIISRACLKKKKNNTSECLYKRNMFVENNMEWHMRDVIVKAFLQ
jgi:hypothetical protein